MQIDVINDGRHYWMRYARYGLGLSYGLTSGKNIDDIPGKLDERLSTVMGKLAGIGNGEDKFLRQIPVCYNIQAPLYWWSEMDTYKVGTTAQSESTMHSLGSVPKITQDMFERNIPDGILNELNIVLNRYRVSHSDMDFMMLKNMLPSGWLQRRMWTANYAVLKNIYRQRNHHRLPEWWQFCETVRKSTPVCLQAIFIEV